MFDKVELTTNDTIFIDNLIKKALMNYQWGDFLMIPLFSEGESESNNKLKQERMNKLASRLHNWIPGMRYKGNFCFIDSLEDIETIKANLVGPQTALLALKTSEQFLQLIAEALINYSGAPDFLIPTISNQQTALIAEHLGKSAAITYGINKENNAKLDIRQKHFKDISKAQARYIAKNLNKYEYTGTVKYEDAGADPRYSGRIDAPVRYLMRCSNKASLTAFFQQLAMHANDYPIPEKVHLMQILWELKSHQYLVHGKGKTLNHKKYAETAGKIAEQIELLLGEEVNLQDSNAIANYKQRSHQLLQNIAHETRSKRNPSAGIPLNWKRRDKTTSELYQKVFDLATDAYCAPETSPLKEIFSKLRNHPYIINGGGKTVSGKKYSESAGKIVEKIELFLVKPINSSSLKEEVRALLTEINAEVIGKQKTTTGSVFFKLGAREQSTVDLYSQIAAICSQHLEKQEPNLSI